MNARLHHIRKTYGLSCRSMSLILGLGVNQWSRMEKGEAPVSRTTELMLLVIVDLRSFKNLIISFEQSLRRELGFNKYDRLIARIDELLSGFSEEERDRYQDFCKKIFECG